MSQVNQLDQNGTHMSEHQNPTTPSSLSDVAAKRAEGKVAGTTPLGTGLEARGVHAWFDKHHALEDVSLDFSAGTCLLYTSPSPRDLSTSRMPSSA